MFFLLREGEGPRPVAAAVQTIAREGGGGEGGRRKFLFWRVCVCERVTRATSAKRLQL